MLVKIALLITLLAYYPTNWADYRTKWLNIFQYRQIANIIGFVSLLIGAVFGTKY